MLLHIGLLYINSENTMRLRTAITSVTTNTLFYDITSTLRGIPPAVVTPLTPIVSLTSFPLSDVTDPAYQTIFSRLYTVEDVGFLEILSIGLAFDEDFMGSAGNGTFKWEISGDGGVNWSTIIEHSFVGALAFVQFLVTGAGLWISQIDAGTNKLQLRLQVKDAGGGTVSSQIYDDSFLSITYRKKVLA